MAFFTFLILGIAFFAGGIFLVITQSFQSSRSLIQLRTACEKAQAQLHDAELDVKEAQMHAQICEQRSTELEQKLKDFKRADPALDPAETAALRAQLTAAKMQLAEKENELFQISSAYKAVKAQNPSPGPDSTAAHQELEAARKTIADYEALKLEEDEKTREMEEEIARLKALAAPVPLEAPAPEQELVESYEALKLEDDEKTAELETLIDTLRGEIAAVQKTADAERARSQEAAARCTRLEQSVASLTAQLQTVTAEKDTLLQEIQTLRPAAPPAGAPDTGEHLTDLEQTAADLLEEGKKTKDLRQQSEQKVREIEDDVKRLKKEGS